MVKYISAKKTHLSPSKFGSVHGLYLMVIWDLEILCTIYGKWAMAPSCVTKRLLPPPLQFLIQSALVAEKKAKLAEMLGKVEEEEPEGEALSEESSGNVSSTKN